MKLKNISNTISKYSKGSTIDILLTKHPITNSREWTKKPILRSGKVDAVQAKGFLEEDESKQYRIVIKPNEIVEFGNKYEFNNEQAEYIYLTYGNKEKAFDERAPQVKNWLIEIDDDGNEVKGSDTLHAKYRENYSI